MMNAWLRFFRFKVLITVPGDTLVGITAILSVSGGDGWVVPALAALVASLAMYMFGLADNDIVGMKTDPAERPLVSGEITPFAAKLARGLCLAVALAAGAAADLPPAWWCAAVALVGSIVVYNRTKWCLLMGLCRGLDVWCAGAALMARARGTPAEARMRLFLCSALWLVYIAGVTKYSERETFDPTNGRKVALLLYGLLFMQIAAVIVLILV